MKLQNTKTVGIIGGMGPAASNYLAKLILERNPFQMEAEHVETIVYNAVRIPDRTAYLLGKEAENPLYKIEEVMEKLERIGAEIITMPCITAHFFREELKQKCRVRFIDIIEELIRFLKSEKITEVGLMATKGTFKSGFLEKVLRENDIKVVLPDEDSVESLMRLIYQQIKVGKPIQIDDFKDCLDDLVNKGCKNILLGCSELSLVPKFDKRVKFIDLLTLMADLCIQYAKEESVEKEYEN